MQATNYMWRENRYKMDVFQEYYTMLKDNEKIFDKYGLNNKYIINNDYLLTGKELLSNDKIEEFMKIRSILYKNIIIKKLKDYSFSEWLICLKENILLEYAIPIFAQVIQKYPMLSGLNGKWQVLYEIVEIKNEFWEKNISWKEYFSLIVYQIILEYQQGKWQDIPEEYLSEFKKFTD